MAKADIGLIGLAVMGQNLVLNMNDHGFKVAVFNRTISKVDDFLNGSAKGTQVIGTHSLGELVSILNKPRRVMLMVQAGKPVDDLIDQLIQLLEAGDIIIDGGNSNYHDTIRRAAYVESKGLFFIGTGISGGEDGARHGPSIMPGGSPAAWPHVKPIFQAIAAKVKRPDGGEDACCDWVGENGAGHYVKMVHNGIEYGMMQALAEGFAVMRASPFALDLTQIAALYNHKSVIESRLVGWLQEAFGQFGENLDRIAGSVSHSGEGSWTVDTAGELGIRVPIIEASLNFRIQSQENPSYAGQLLSAMRNQFGGHDVFIKR